MWHLNPLNMEIPWHRWLTSSIFCWGWTQDEGPWRPAPFWDGQWAVKIDPVDPFTQERYNQLCQRLPPWEDIPVLMADRYVVFFWDYLLHLGMKEQKTIVHNWICSNHLELNHYSFLWLLSNFARLGPHVLIHIRVAYKYMSFYNILQCNICIDILITYTYTHAQA